MESSNDGPYNEKNGVSGMSFDKTVWSRLHFDSIWLVIIAQYLAVFGRLYPPPPRNKHGLVPASSSMISMHFTIPSGVKLKPPSGSPVNESAPH